MGVGERGKVGEADRVEEGRKGGSGRERTMEEEMLGEVERDTTT